LIRSAVERGVTFSTPAEAYGPSPRNRGRASLLSGQGVIATKFGFKFDANGKQAGLDSRPEHIKEVAERFTEAPKDRCHRPFYNTVLIRTFDRRRRRSGERTDSAGQGEALGTFGKRECGHSYEHTHSAVTALQSEYSLWWKS